MEGTVHIIGGLSWRTIVNPILDRQAAFEVAVAESGLEALAPFAAEPMAEFLVRAVHVLYANEKAWTIYGLLLLPADVDDAQWTRAHARKTAEFFRTLQGAEDQRLAQKILAEGMFGFFMRRLTFDGPFRTSLELAAALETDDAPSSGPSL